MSYPGSLNVVPGGGYGYSDPEYVRKTAQGERGTADDVVTEGIPAGEDEIKQISIDYTIKGRPAFAFVDLNLSEGEQVQAEAGAMLWMDSQMPIETGCTDGPYAACLRSCGGQSCCMNTFTGPGRVSFGFELPGDILPFAVSPGHGWILTQSAYIVGTENCKVDARFAGCMACCFGGEGMFLTRVSSHDSPGIFFAGGYGALERHEVPAGKELLVDTGLFFAAHADTKIRVGWVGRNLKAMCCGGEMFVMKFRGPCVVYTQSRDPAIFAPIPTQAGGGASSAGDVAGAM